jgi:hypothetical protein
MRGIQSIVPFFRGEPKMRMSCQIGAERPFMRSDAERRNEPQSKGTISNILFYLAEKPIEQVAVRKTHRLDDLVRLD